MQIALLLCSRFLDRFWQFDHLALSPRLKNKDLFEICTNVPQAELRHLQVYFLSLRWVAGSIIPPPDWLEYNQRFYHGHWVVKVAPSCAPLKKRTGQHAYPASLPMDLSLEGKEHLECFPYAIHIWLNFQCLQVWKNMIILSWRHFCSLQDLKERK